MTMLEDRLRKGLAAEADARSLPTRLPQVSATYSAKGARVALVAAAFVLVVVGGTTLVTRAVTPTDTGSAVGAIPSGTTDTSKTPDTVAPVVGFSADEAAAMPVVPAEYGFDLGDWQRRIAMGLNAGGSAPLELSAEDLTEDLVTVVRSSTSAVLADIDATPPYGVRVIRALRDSEDTGWFAGMTVDHSGGDCLVIVESDAVVYGECRSGEDSDARGVLLDLGVGGYGYDGLVDPATVTVGDWVEYVWWGLPESVVDVVYWRDAGDGVESDISINTALGGTVWIARALAGVEQPIRVQARDAEGTVIIDNTLMIPAASADAPATAATLADYDMDAGRFADLLRGETFLGGGTVLGERWAIVGRTMAEQGKETLQCVGVRPILSEDSCGGGDFLSWMVLPVGDGGVVVFKGPDDASHVRVAFDDGRVVDIPFVGLSEGYPPIAVISVERIGENGTAYAMNESGEILYSTDFEVSSFAEPKG